MIGGTPSPPPTPPLARPTPEERVRTRRSSSSPTMLPSHRRRGRTLGGVPDPCSSPRGPPSTRLCNIAPAHIALFSMHSTYIPMASNVASALYPLWHAQSHLSVRGVVTLLSVAAAPPRAASVSRLLVHERGADGHLSRVARDARLRLSRDACVSRPRPRRSTSPSRDLLAVATDGSATASRPLARDVAERRRPRAGAVHAVTARRCALKRARATNRRDGCVSTRRRMISAAALRARARGISRVVFPSPRVEGRW